jgi:hypothetical protein
MSGIGNNEFYPSAIEDALYKIINTEEHVISFSEYDRTIVPEISAYLGEHAVRFNIIEDPYPNMTGASLSICWMEGCQHHLHHIVLNIKY